MWTFLKIEQLLFAKLKVNLFEACPERSEGRKVQTAEDRVAVVRRHCRLLVVYG
jgi:hypothetical protein